MYCLTNTCYVCLGNKDKLVNINSSSVNVDIIHIIGYLPFHLDWMKTKQIILICEECCRRLRETYQFLTMCHKNSAVLQGYMAEINTANISDADYGSELRVALSNKQDDVIAIKCEIKSEDEEVHTFERGPILEVTEEVFVNVDDSLVKEEDTWKREAEDDEEEPPMENNSTECSDKQSDTDSDGSGFTSTQGHTANEKELNTAAKKSHKCSTCNQSFRTKTHLQKHARVHTGEKPYKCSTCEKCFRKKSGLARHMRLHTGKKPFKCSTCNKCFVGRLNLMCHMRTHTGENPYECSVCKKCYSVHGSLVNHMRTHTDEKPYKCSRCEKCFGQRAHLASHMRTHTGEKPYECSRCKKCFRSQTGLVYHTRVHTGEKPFECSLCKKCFRNSSNLLAHMRRHSGNEF